jgi:hypothetical protein
LSKQKRQLNGIAQVKESSYIKVLDNLLEYKENILTEIANRGGFGPRANEALEML